MQSNMQKFEGLEPLTFRGNTHTQNDYFKE